MTLEDKDLLLKDLCARLPYSIKCINVAWPKDGYVRISNIRAEEQKYRYLKIGLILNIVSLIFDKCHL